MLIYEPPVWSGFPKLNMEPIFFSRLVASYCFLWDWSCGNSNYLVFRCVIGTSCKNVLSDIWLGVGWLWLGMVLVVGDFSGPQPRHSLQTSRILPPRLGRLVQARCRVWPQMAQVALVFHFMTTQWQSVQVKVRVSGIWLSVTKLFTAGWWRGCSWSEFGMVIIAGRWQQLQDPKSLFRRLSICSSGLCIVDVLWRRWLRSLPCCTSVGTSFRICCTGS